MSVSEGYYIENDPAEPLANSSVSSRVSSTAHPMGKPLSITGPLNSANQIQRDL